VVGEYGLSERAANRTSFTGYLEREGGRRSRADVRRELDLRTDRLVVVTAGGGKDGWRLYQAMLDDQRRLDRPAYDTLIVGGPLLEREEQRELQARARDLPHVHVLDSTTDLPGYLAAADAVVAMGGYNTVCEVLSLQKPTLIVPRTFPRKEQLIRASVLSQRRYVDMLHPADLEQGRLLRATWSLMEERRPRPVLQMDGLGNAARVVSGLLGRPDMATLTGAGA
jgi:predicted glycosyltransferase